MEKIDWREASRKLDKMFVNKQSEPKDEIDLFSELQEKFATSTNKESNHSEGFRDFTKIATTKSLEPNLYVQYSRYLEKNCFALANRFILDSEDSEMNNQYDHRISDMQSGIETKISKTHAKDRLENTTGLTFDNEKLMMKAQQKLEIAFYSYKMDMLKGYTEQAQETKAEMVDTYKGYKAAQQAIKETFQTTQKKSKRPEEHYIQSLGMTISKSSLERPSEKRMDIISQIQKAVKENIKAQSNQSNEQKVKGAKLN